MWTETGTLLSVGARHQRRLSWVVAVLQEGLREEDSRVTSCLLTCIAKVAQGVRYGHVVRVAGHGRDASLEQVKTATIGEHFLGHVVLR